MKRCVYITVGYPGSGKTTWAKAFEGVYLGADDHRRMFVDLSPFGDPMIRHKFRELTKYVILTRQRCIVDDCHMTPEDRRHLIAYAAEAEMPLVARVFNVPWEVCHRRRPKAFRGTLVLPTKEEGFTEIEVWTPPFA